MVLTERSKDGGVFAVEGRGLVPHLDDIERLADHEADGTWVVSLGAQKGMKLQSTAVGGREARPALRIRSRRKS